MEENKKQKNRIKAVVIILAVLALLLIAFFLIFKDGGAMLLPLPSQSKLPKRKVLQTAKCSPWMFCYLT